MYVVITMEGKNTERNLTITAGFNTGTFSPALQFLHVHVTSVMSLCTGQSTQGVIFSYHNIMKVNHIIL